MSSELLSLFWDSFVETLIMVGIAGGIATAVGIPLGLILSITAPGNVLERPLLNRTLGLLVNAVRSTPFIILMVAIIPLTRLITGTSIGTAAAVVPLAIAAIPFVGRLIEGALREVDAGLVEAAQAMGATPLQVVRKVLVPEALPGIINGLTIMLVNLIGFSAMAGAVGGGGLGDLGIRYGYQRFMPEVMAMVVLILIVVVQLVQTFGDVVASRVDHR
ncbi:ABC transporter permease [Rhodocyclus tenuis]|uniref:ABC transporter permease n=1 Tax=Rhodocyclus gracilis TaxID=2929842 RepID=A0ABX0WH61_9RHOO|nr:methionine ABC transporter permease [Rhodocyclus gracilis]MRD71853.1 methionine ABC transporter permease MetI [Rhodocyclus gracilis]NJA87753.1 ABC transporter permease [Rhodocyclus gracilis]